MRGNKGFTLIELVVVIVIIFVLIHIAKPAYESTVLKVKSGTNSAGQKSSKVVY